MNSTMVVILQRALLARCKRCAWEAHAGAFNVALSTYRLLACPQCRSEDIDTSDVAAHDAGFRFGSNNHVQRAGSSK